MVFNGLLRMLRRSKKLSQEGLADELGVSRQAVCNWERGASLPDVASLPFLAKALGVPIGWLICGYLFRVGALNASMLRSECNCGACIARCIMCGWHDALKVDSVPDKTDRETEA